MKILNLYSGIGGNRKLWQDEEVIAVEHNEDIAKIYADFFPQDDVVVANAHKYLLHHYAKYDFIWSSPPCPTHSRCRYNLGVLAKGFTPVYPDMALYQEIIFLQHHFSGKYVVENTASYYDPLIQPQRISRHYFWANFIIPPISVKPTGIGDKNKIRELEKTLGFDLSPYSISNKRQILRNCVNPQLGLHILKASYTTKPTPDPTTAKMVRNSSKQLNMFDAKTLATNLLKTI